MQFLELMKHKVVGSQKTLVSSIEETPVIPAIEVESIPNKQKFKSFVRDTIHLVYARKTEAKLKVMSSFITSSSVMFPIGAL